MEYQPSLALGTRSPRQQAADIEARKERDKARVREANRLARERKRREGIHAATYEIPLQQLDAIKRIKRAHGFKNESQALAHILDQMLAQPSLRKELGLAA
ncbi:MAG: hypothetical protein KGP14_00395 [Betaproteobacteria bacterium]|nr:hypothetical protein [Betaproteobacteria bacterium]